MRGRRFLHPRLGFTFLAPEGFALDNTPQAVLGIKDGGGQALRLDVVRVPAEQPLAAYLTSGWIENIDGNTVEEITLGGFPAATALARGDQWAFRLFVIRFGSEVYRFIFAVKQMTPAGRPLVPRRRQQLPPHDQRRGRRDQAAAHPHRARSPKATPSSGSPPAWRPTARRSASASSTGSVPPTACAPASR